MAHRKPLIFLISLILLSPLGMAQTTTQPPKHDGDVAKDQRKPSEALFPCPLPKGKKLPPLILIGEVHRHPICQQIGCDLFDRAAADKCFVGVEGVYCGQAMTPQLAKETYGSNVQNVSLIKGVDEEYSHGIAIQIATLVPLRDALRTHDKDTAFGVVGTFVVNALGNSALLAQWKEFRKTYQPEGSEKQIALLMDSCLEESKEAATKRLLALEKSHPWRAQPEKVEGVLSRFFLFSGKWGNDPSRSQRYFIPPTFLKDIEDFSQNRNVDAAGIRLAITWRNEFIARGISRIYCDSLALETPKPVYVMLGLDHLAGVPALIKAGSEGAVVPQVKMPRM